MGSDVLCSLKGCPGGVGQKRWQEEMLSLYVTGGMGLPVGPPGSGPADSCSVLGNITVILASPVTLSAGPSWATLQLASLQAQDKVPVHSGSGLLCAGVACQHSPGAAGPTWGQLPLTTPQSQATVPRDSLSGITALPVTDTFGTSGNTELPF